MNKSHFNKVLQTIVFLGSRHLGTELGTTVDLSGKVSELDGSIRLLKRMGITLQTPKTRREFDHSTNEYVIRTYPLISCAILNDSSVVVGREMREALCDRWNAA